MKNLLTKNEESVRQELLKVLDAMPSDLAARLYRERSEEMLGMLDQEITFPDDMPEAEQFAQRQTQRAAVQKMLDEVMPALWLQLIFTGHLPDSKMPKDSETLRAVLRETIAKLPESSAASLYKAEPRRILNIMEESIQPMPGLTTEQQALNENAQRMQHRNMVTQMMPQLFFQWRAMGLL